MAIKDDQPDKDAGERARSLRQTQTVSEGLLWSALRARQLCSLKFRRQHPIETWIVDFACPEQRLIVEIDGGYHDDVVEQDLKRQQHFESMGWKVLRFGHKDVEENAEAVARAIAKEHTSEVRVLTSQSHGIRDAQHQRNEKR
jgi:very-short-patch-repair endonuclease